MGCRIQISLHDGLPQHICYECLSRIELFHNYKQSCIESQHTLKHWDLFCEGGSVPQDVDIFSGRSTSPDMLLDAVSSPINRNRTENNFQRFKDSELTPPRKTSHLGSPAIDKQHTATPPRRKNVESTVLEMKKEFSPQIKKNVTERVSSLGTSVAQTNKCESIPSLDLLNPLSYLHITIRDSNGSEINSSKQISGKRAQNSRNSENNSKCRRSLSPYLHADRKDNNSEEMPQLLRSDGESSGMKTRRNQSPGRSNSSGEKIVDKSTNQVTRSPTPLREVKSSPSKKMVQITQNQINDITTKVPKSRMTPRSQSIDVSKNAENSAVISSLKSPKIQITKIESLAGLSKESPKSKLSIQLQGKTPLKAKKTINSNESATDKNNTLKISQVVGSNERTFAPTISEIVKQRKRSNVESSDGTSYVKKKRKHNVKSTSLSPGVSGVNKENSVTKSSVPLSEKNENSPISINKQQVLDELDTRDDSTEAVLKVLESDDGQSNSEDVESDNSRPSTSESNKEMNPYVKVEKLSKGRKIKEDINSKGVSNAHVSHKRPYHRREQSSQYRMVKLVKDFAGRERFKCLKCGSMLSSKCYIREHMKIHTGDKDYKCEQCGKAFRNNFMLKAHAAVHMKDRKFSCSICGNTFVQEDRLKQHFRMHTIEKLECTICGHKTSQKPAMRRHMRIHTGERPFECEFCGGRYTDRSTWINHRRIHTGERPYKCKHCGKAFARIVYLQGHLRSHSDERPFPCHICPSSFKTKAHLVKHLSSIHKELMQSVVTMIKEELEASGYNQETASPST